MAGCVGSLFFGRVVLDGGWLDEMFGFGFLFFFGVVGGLGGYRGRRAEADRLGLVTGPLIWLQSNNNNALVLFSG